MIILPVVAIIKASANLFAFKHSSTAASTLFKSKACVINPSVSEKKKKKLKINKIEVPQ